MKKLIWLFGILFLMITGCDKYDDLPPVISVSVSSDGKYAVAVHDDSKNVPHGGTLILWDIENQTNQILAKNANVFSVAFVPDSHEFIWQDDEDIVHIQTVEGKEVKRFENITTYGQLIDDKDNYIFSDINWHLYRGYGKDKEKIKYDSKGDYFNGAGKVINLSTSDDFIVSGGAGFIKLKNSEIKYPPVLLETELKPYSLYSGVTLWDKNTLKPLSNLLGNVAKTTARISPDGKWVVGGDEGGGRYLWSTTPPFKREKLIDMDGSGSLTAVHTIVFVDQGNYFLIIYHNALGSRDRVSIFKTGDVKAVADTQFEETPRPCVEYYQRNLCIASAPDANIIVTGQEDHGGINVYKFHPETLTLEPVWIAK